MNREYIKLYVEDAVFNILYYITVIQLEPLWCVVHNV